MPILGEIKWSGSHKFQWCACVGCSKERWIRLRRNKPINLQCLSCANRKRFHSRGKNNPSWKGGRITCRADGYVLVYIESDDFFHSMANLKGYTFEHRLIMAKHLGRCLLPWEIVHHKNGIKDDNRLENLELLPTSRQHLSDLLLKAMAKRQEKRIGQLEKRLTLLEAENQLLRTNYARMGQ